MRLSVLLLLLSLCGLQACCKKVDCASPIITGAQLHNFSEADADSVIIRSYARNTGFTTPVDSVFTKSQPSVFRDSTYCSLPLPTAVSRDRNFRVDVLSSGHVFLISEFQYAHGECNKCFLNDGNGYEYLNGYTLNGEYVSGTNVILEK